MSLRDELRKQQNSMAIVLAQREREGKELSQLLRQEFKRLDPAVRSVLDEVGAGLWGRSFGLFRRYRVEVLRDNLKHGEPRWQDEGAYWQTGHPEIWIVREIVMKPTSPRPCTVGLWIGPNSTSFFVNRGFLKDTASKEVLENAFRRIQHF